MNSDDDDMELLSYLNTNNKLAKSEAVEKPRKRMRISAENSENSTVERTAKGNAGNQVQNRTEVPGLFNVHSVSRHDSHLELTLKEILQRREGLSTKVEEMGALTSCYLYDSWMSFDVVLNDTVQILVDETQADGSYKVDDKHGLIILNPHLILSGTAVIGTLFCLRKSALNWKFKEQGAGNYHMVLGNILHGIFQKSITNKKYEKHELKAMLMEMLRSKQIINQLYECDKDEEFILKETEIYLISIEKWLHEHVKIPLGRKKTTEQVKTLQIQNVCDIEESIWSPKYGIKGKIDLTLQLEIKMSAYSTLAKKTTDKKEADKVETHVVPVELKSGKTTFSAEHEGQVMLYSLLNKEKRKASDFGLLLYLKDMKSKFVKVSDNSIRGLIQMRNELVHYISSSKFPALKNEERVCSKCSYLTVCSLFNKNSLETDSTYEKTYNELPLYADSISHLNKGHQKYFFRWYSMLEHEFKDQKQFESGNLVFWKSQEELEAKGWTVFDLQLAKAFAGGIKDDNEYSGEGFHAFDFKKMKSSGQKVNLKEGDMILLSSQTDKLVGISQGFIRSIRSNGTQFTLNLDKNLALFKTTSEHLFRIEKINYRSAIQLNYTNLGKLMDPKHSNLRSYIIDKTPPQFDAVLPKQNVLKTKHFFKTLNQSQQAAILKAMMAKDYLLIKGYPGTGKTTTIAALIAILTHLEKKVLFCCFTNSAVDNLLVKVHSTYPVDFLRIGSHEKIHPDIQKFELNSLLSDIKNTKTLYELYRQKQLIATTCSSITHTVFSKIEFDYCIIDEASQVLLTTCLGPLYSAKKFILVGDLEQLPPIVKNNTAREMGMNVSLFEWLDCNQAAVELVHQYRMNDEIMSLANEVTYSGKLKCVSEKVANSRIDLDPKFLSSIQSDKTRQILTSSVVFIDTTDLVSFKDCSVSESTDTELTENVLEANIVQYLCEQFYKYSECKDPECFGVIAPYNIQVNAIQKKFSTKKFYQDIEVSTVDQYQGRDKRIIIMSFTNTQINKQTKEFEILNDKRRLTVAITRAKEKLILIGSTRSLNRYKELSTMITSLKEKGLVVKLTEDDEISNSIK